MFICLIRLRIAFWVVFRIKEVRIRAKNKTCHKARESLLLHSQKQSTPRSNRHGESLYTLILTCQQHSYMIHIVNYKHRLLALKLIRGGTRRQANTRTDLNYLPNLSPASKLLPQHGLLFCLPASGRTPGLYTFKQHQLNINRYLRCHTTGDVPMRIKFIPHYRHSFNSIR